MDYWIIRVRQLTDGLTPAHRLFDGDERRNLFNCYQHYSVPFDDTTFVFIL